MAETKKEPPRLKNAELARIEALLNELARPMFVWRMARGKLMNGKGNTVTERLKRVNALGEIAEILGSRGYRRPRSHAGHYMGYTKYAQTGHMSRQPDKMTRHITEVDDDVQISLCGHALTQLITRVSDDQLILLTDYWQHGTPAPGDLCLKCVAKLESQS